MVKRLILLALLSACPVLANTLIVVGTDNSLGQNMWISENGTNKQVWSGGIDLTVDSYARVVFCVELFININVATYNTVLDFADTPSLKRAAWLLNNYYPTDAVTGSAMQLAIWDIMTDNADGFTSGLVQKSTGTATPATVLADAVNYETLSTGKSSTSAVIYHNTLNGTPVQTLIGLWPSTGPEPIAPEPAAIFLMIGGLALIGLGRLRLGRRS
jgi:hypothetical protein